MIKTFFSKPIKWLVVVAVIALVGWFWQQSKTVENPNLLLYGNVDIREVQLAFRQPGRIETMLFDEGDSVQAGDKMATLDAQPYQEALRVAEATVALAEAELAKMKRGLRPQEISQAEQNVNQALAIERDTESNYRRQHDLYETGLSSQRALDAARAAYEQAVAQVKSARAALSQAVEGFRGEDIAAAEARLASAQAHQAQVATALADTELVAPSEGTVITRTREPGSMVTSQQTVYSLSLNSPVYVRAYIGEQQLGRIAPGTQVKVYSDSSSKTYVGQVGFISPRAEFTPKTVETTDLRTDLVYRLRIVVTNADKALRQGMPVTIEVENDWSLAPKTVPEH